MRGQGDCPAGLLSTGPLIRQPGASPSRGGGREKEQRSSSAMERPQLQTGAGLQDSVEEGGAEG